MTWPSITRAVEIALEACGCDRVHHNDGTPPAIAIRWVDVKVPPAEKWLVRTGVDHNEAGALAAKDFAALVRDEGKRLVAWADRIDAALSSDGQVKE